MRTPGGLRFGGRGGFGSYKHYGQRQERQEDRHETSGELGADDTRRADVMDL